jgi:hypothetical protein
VKIRVEAPTHEEARALGGGGCLVSNHLMACWYDPEKNVRSVTFLVGKVTTQLTRKRDGVSTLAAREVEPRYIQ